MICFRVQRYFEIYLLSVISEYGGKGIEKQLVEHSLQVAKEKGCTTVKSDLASSFSRKICVKREFETVFEIRYADEFPLYDKMDESSKQLHPT